MPRAATQALRSWSAHRKRAKLRRMAGRRYRDECGRFARAPGWWRPRDNRGRFLPLDHLKSGGTFQRREWLNEVNITSDYRAPRNTVTWPATSGTIYAGNAQVYADNSYIGTATNVTFTGNVYFDWNNTSTTATSMNLSYTATGNYTTFTPPKFAAKMVVTQMEARELGYEQAVQRAVEMAKREMDRTFRNEGLEVDFNQGVWRQWTQQGGVGGWELDAVEVNVEWTPQPMTQEAWATWTSPAAQRLGSADTPMVEDDAARRVRERIEEEQLVMAEEAAARRRVDQAERERKATEARERAMDLMRTVLAPEQVESWEREKAFTVETANGRRRYRIKSGRAGNIYLMKDGDREAEAEGRAFLKRYCFHEYHPTERPPVEDNVIAQALFIEAHEEEFLAAANEF